MLHAFDAMSKLYGSVRYPELRYKNHSNSKLYEMWKLELIKYIKDNNLRRWRKQFSFTDLKFITIHTLK